MTDFWQWVSVAPHGATYPYHRGFLINDRYIKWPVEVVAQEVMKAYARGLVTLKQLRHGEGDYAYIAERTRHPVNARANERPGVTGYYSGTPVLGLVSGQKSTHEALYGRRTVPHYRYTEE